MPEKQCFKCGEVKDINEFYKHPQMADGHLNKCKECTKTDTIQNRMVNYDYYAEYDRIRGRLPHRVAARKEYIAAHPEIKKKCIENYSIKYPEKHTAHQKTGNAIRDNRLIKQPCEVCGEREVEAHHDDYSKPLEVRWLCQRHHCEVHGKLSRSHVEDWT